MLTLARIFRSPNLISSMRSSSSASLLWCHAHCSCLAAVSRPSADSRLTANTRPTADSRLTEISAGSLAHSNGPSTPFDPLSIEHTEGVGGTCSPHPNQQRSGGDVGDRPTEVMWAGCYKNDIDWPMPHAAWDGGTVAKTEANEQRSGRVGCVLVECTTTPIVIPHQIWHITEFQSHSRLD